MVNVWTKKKTRTKDILDVKKVRNDGCFIHPIHLNFGSSMVLFALERLGHVVGAPQGQQTNSFSKNQFQETIIPPAECFRQAGLVFVYP